MTAREGNTRNSHPEKTNVDRGEAEVDTSFRGFTISYVTVPSRAVNIYYIKLNVNFKNTSSHFVWFQNNPGEVNICVCISYSVYSNALTTPVRIYGEPYAHKFCAVDVYI